MVDVLDEGDDVSVCCCVDGRPVSQSRVGSFSRSFEGKCSLVGCDDTRGRGGVLRARVGFLKRDSPLQVMSGIVNAEVISLSAGDLRKRTVFGFEGVCRDLVLVGCGFRAWRGELLGMRPECVEVCERRSGNGRDS